ncbi:MULTISPECIES: hypothetical protein [unclassified Micromonospora]|uniref:hypothetical protein n=1 Tax=unclassified Micromonospora TaxID=2617518 RepID=UPI0033192A34
MTPSGISRRGLLIGAAASGALAGLGAAPATPARAAETPDFTTRAAFDALDLGFNGGNGRKDDLNDNRGALGWGESYVLQAYLLMYEAHRDTYYLDKAIDHIDHVLANRDSVRGVVDWRGLSLPAWQTGDPYSVGEVLLTDAQGRPTLRVRSALAFSATSRLTVTPGTNPGTFKLWVYSAYRRVGDTYDNLSMDPASPDYAVRRINESFYVGGAQVTVKDVRPSPDAAGEPVPVDTLMTAPKFHSVVHTGQIAYPIAKFARLVAADPKLRSSSPYRDKAREYYAAADAALAVHDREFVQEGRYGYYIALRDDPVNYDGVDWPHNYYTSVARAYLELYRAGLRPAHAERASALVHTFRDDIRWKSAGTAAWTYYWTRGWPYRGWTPEDRVSNNIPRSGASTRLEDVSHGHIDVQMMVTAYEAGLVARRADMRALAATLSREIITTRADGQPTVWSYVGPAGVIGSAASEQIVAGWLALAPYDEDRRMVEAVATMYRNQNPAPGIVPIYGAAWLNWASRVR